MILDYLRSVSQQIDTINNALDAQAVKADALQQKLETLMKTAPDFDELLGKMEAETTRIGEKFAELFGKLKDGGLSAAEEEAAFNRGITLSERLVGLGKDPDNPVPPTEE